MPVAQQADMQANHREGTVASMTAAKGIMA
jgi:hypothetical protein